MLISSIYKWADYMLYNLIVLGIIPGTNSQINFYGLLLVLSVILGILSALSALRERGVNYVIDTRTNFEQISI